MKNYDAILNGEKKCNYLACKKIPAYFEGHESYGQLWKGHDAALKREEEENVEVSLLDLKIEIAERIFRECHFCEHRCMVDRSREKGICNVGKAAIATEFLHYGEEAMLVPSHTIFFSGCNFSCVFCQNWDISQRQRGIYIEPEKLASIIESRNGRNVNWVGGEPTPNLPYVLQVLKHCNANLPQIWNSNMYCSVETMKLLDGIIDLYLTDFKYGNDSCAYRLSGVKNYMEVVERNHSIAYKQADMIIRHLVMPNHVECCSLPVLEWISKNAPQAWVNIMDQYRPEYRAYEHAEINRVLGGNEYRKAFEYGKEMELKILR
ncbi:MAG: radical SAM protein [Thermoplasmata archaeon]|mgnify:CR=1 FL=1|nr:MAG: radical SAM protein [Thermoplasmata archaeon]